MSIGRASYESVSFYILGDQDAEREACGVTNSKALFSEGVPVANGLYDPHYGTTELGWNCQTCFNNKMLCPGHDGVAKMNYPLQSPLFRKEILKWLRIVCHSCGEFVIKAEVPSAVAAINKLGEFVKQVRSGNEKNRKCAYCNVEHPWVTKDPTRPGVIWREWFVKGNKTKSERKEQMYNHEIRDIFGRIPNANVIKMGKTVESHPRKLILESVKISSTVIRPEIRKIGGNRSTMSDTTAHLKNIMEYNASIPKEMPQEIDADLHAKLILIDLSFYEMIAGSSAVANTSTLRLVTNTNKVSNSLAARLPKKHGRLRANLMGRRTTKMMRSVITGDKALRPDQVGVPKMIAKNLYISETVRPWNRDRLTIYFLNGPKIYPGCSKVRKLDTGFEHYVENMSKDYVLQDGDQVFRHLITGDSVGFNREPSLLYCSIAVLSAKVISGFTLRINSTICALFNADFDGDEMNGIQCSSIESIAETKIISSVSNWFISYQTSDPMLGLFQDSIIGAYEMTQNGVVFDKFHAMRLCNRTSTDAPLRFDKAEYTSRELISKFLPAINFEGRAKFYVPEYTQYIKYNDDEINVRIQRGELKSGVLDKATVGQGANGGIFHTIYAEKGAPTALECMYNMQQIINTYIYYKGVTFGLADVYLSDRARAKLVVETSKIIAASEDVTRQLNEGKLVAPIEMTLKEYYEELQTAALEHGDEFIKPIMEEIDTRENWLYKFVYSGSKGDPVNLTAIYASIGSIGLKGGRIPFALNGRTSINFQRYDTNPISRGYCPNSFSTGISAIVFPFAAMEARYELIEIALSTAQAGTMNRNAVKNLESIVVSNQRGSIKKNRIVQLLFGETGIDPRKVERVQFPTVKCGTAAFKTAYHAQTQDLSKRWRHKEAQAALDEEFRLLTADREEFRAIMFKLEAHQRRNFIMKDVLRMPVNPAREIQNVAELAREIKRKPEDLDPLKSTRLVAEYCATLGYRYMNEIQRTARAEIPHSIKNAVTLLKILIRSWLCTKNLVKNGIDNALLEQILERVSLKISECFIEYGTSVGIIAAQSISEPITQFLLNAKHRSGLKKDKTNMIVRFDEILKDKNTEDMDNPQMTLIPLPEYQDDRQKVIEIANHIEMLPLSRFVTSTQIFMEAFQKPEHPEYTVESKLIQKFQAFNLGEQVPKDLISWCIRMTLNREELVLKSMKIKTIFIKLMERFPNVYIVYTTQNAPQIILRVYIRNVMFKRGGDINEENIRCISHDLQSTVIRGVEGITTANVRSIPHTFVNPEGALEVKKLWAIETDGTNLSLVLENQYLLAYECNTTSVDEIEHLYGIEAARNKIVDELLTTEKHKANYEWTTIYADEMSYNGRVTSIQRSGLGQRELNNVMLRASFGSPIQVVQQAAINNQTDTLHGMSAPLVVGACPQFGTTFNDVIIDLEAVREMTTSDAELIDAI